MTDQEINETIAELRGWRKHGQINGRLLMWPPNHGDACEPPSFTTDLNALAPVLFAMDYGQRMRFSEHLISRLKPGEWEEVDKDETPMFWLCNLAPRELCEAILLAAGKWRDK